MPLNKVTITGTFDDGSGTALSGTAVFTPSQTVYYNGQPAVQANNPVSVAITGGALQSVQLVATDNSPVEFISQTGFWFWTVTLTLNGVTQPGFSFFLPHTPSTVDLFTLANTAASGGGGVTFPITIAEGGTGQVTQQAALNALAGAVTSGQFLRGNGTNMLVAPIQAGDVPGFDGVTVTGTPSSGQVPTATGSSAATWQTPAAGFQAWQFQPETYGAMGDGRVVGDVVINSTTTITSATAAFVSGDVGKVIMINGGQGATAAPLVTTIASVTNSTTAVLTAAATASGTAAAAVIGTDDTAAINSAVQAAGTYALAHDYFAEVVFGAKIYMVATDRVQSGNGTTTPTFNTQIAIPYPNANGTTPKLVFHLTGAGDAGFYQYWESTVPNLAGTALVSTSLSAPSTPDATFGNQSVIGGPAGSAGYTGGFANVKVVVKGIEVVSPAYTNQYAFDFGFVSALRITQSSAHILAPTGLNGGTSPLLKDLPAQVAFQGKIGAGLRAPVTGNNAEIFADEFVVEGYSRGLYVFDHFTANKISTLYNDVALKIDLSQGLSGTSHGIFIGLFGAEVYNGGISVNGSGSNFVQAYINLDAEVAPSPAYDVSDGGSGALHGEIHWADPADNRNPGVNASAVHFVNDKLGPGHMSTNPPAVPASGTPTAATLTGVSGIIYRDAWVVIHTGSGVTVSAINIDGTVTGLTMAASSSLSVRIPSGKAITLTYAGGTPTWDWWLD